MNSILKYVLPQTNVWGSFFGGLTFTHKYIILKNGRVFALKDLYIIL